MSAVRPEVTGSRIGGSVSRGPVVATVTQAMIALQIGRATLYEHLNSGEIASYREGKGRKILWSSIDAFIERRLQAEAELRKKRMEKAD